MALPPMWKVRREMWRVIGKTRMGLMRLRGPQASVTYQGLKIPLNRPGMKSDVLMAILRNGYELPEILGQRRAIRTGDRVLELGSGLGIITALAARAAGPTGLVLSYEANPDMIPATREFLSAHGLGTVELRHAVLDPTASIGATRQFHLSKSFSMSSLLDLSKRSTGKTISVPAENLNAVIVSFCPDVLICDIEGAEIELLPALDASHLREIVVELHPDRLTQLQIDSIYSALAVHGLFPDKRTLGGTVVQFARKTH
jgi:FkbM family methyltransferase